MKRFFLIALQFVVVTTLALAYPFYARSEAWSSATFEHPWLLLGLLTVPFVFWWGTVGQDVCHSGFKWTSSPIARELVKLLICCCAGWRQADEAEVDGLG